MALQGRGEGGKGEEVEGRVGVPAYVPHTRLLRGCGILPGSDGGESWSMPSRKYRRGHEELSGTCSTYAADTLRPSFADGFLLCPFFFHACRLTTCLRWRTAIATALSTWRSSPSCAS